MCCKKRCGTLAELEVRIELRETELFKPGRSRKWMFRKVRGQKIHVGDVKK